MERHAPTPPRKKSKQPLTPMNNPNSIQTPCDMFSDTDPAPDFYSRDSSEIKELTSFPEQGFTHEYLTSGQHGIGRAIALEHDECGGIVVVERYSYGGTELTDAFGSAVGVHAVLPSYFERLRKSYPEDVSEILDTPYLYGDAVTVFLVHPDGRAEYGSIPRAALPSRGLTTANATANGSGAE